MTDDNQPRGRGRPKLYETRGAPKITVRLTPDLLEWVQEHGGAVFVRGLIEQARQLEAAPAAPPAFGRQARHKDE